MILRRLYLYLVSAAALGVLAVGLVLLGATVVLFVLHDPSADYNRGALAIYGAMTLVALPVWAVHFGFAQRFALRDPYERASALRRLYLYWACLFSSLGATLTIGFGAAQLLLPVLDGQPFNPVPTAQLGWATAVLAAIWAAHFLIARRDRAATPEEGASATLRRWYMYIALLAGMLAMLAGTASLLQVGWSDLALGTVNAPYLSGPAGLAIAGLVLWSVHARVIALWHTADDRHSTLRALEGFIAVAICIAVALTGASQILYYLLARVLGVEDPGGAGTNLVAAAAAPGSQLLVYGIAWFLVSRRLTRDAATQEADRQAAIRRLYTNLASLISLAAMAIGAGLLLWNLAEQIEAPIIGVTAEDWKNPVSVSVTLLVVGGAVWLAHWRHSPWATDRQSLSRKLYVWAALLGSVLAVLAGGVGIVNALLQQLVSANPHLSDRANLDVGHYLAVILVAAAVGFYHWRVLHADAAARPQRPEHEPEKPKVQVVAPAMTSAVASAAADELGPHSQRYTLVVTDATDDDLHQALSTLPPAASYRLTHAEQAVDGR
jgi:uncharacterized protein DUF5671